MKKNYYYLNTLWEIVLSDGKLHDYESSLDKKT